MNFFERQEQARGRTKLLVFLFCSALFLTFAAILSLVAWFAALGTEASSDATTGELFVRYLAEPALIANVAAAVFLLIGGASLFKLNELRSMGADGVAVALGGTRIGRATTNPAERRLYNIVEEMALASGVPVPSVYVMREEKGINACAIGGDPESSAIAVTDGALRSLNRDELQGVVAHEFGHLLNGDVKMNMRLIGVLFGLQMLTLIGLVIFRSTARFSLISSSGNRKNQAAGVILAIWLFALGVVVIGLIGVFFSNVIRAAISRQREFLADASAAQFTRNPAGLAGALKKIGALAGGSEVWATRSAEMAHLFFGSVFSDGLTALFRTHPNLIERIRRLEPTFDGNFERFRETMTFDAAYDAGNGPTASLGGGPLYNGTGPGNDVPAVDRKLVGTVFEEGARLRLETERLRVVASSLVDLIGTQAAEKLDVAGTLLQQTPPELEPLLGDFDGARAIIYALLADSDRAVQQRQLETIRKMEGKTLDAKIAVAFQAVAPLSFSARATVARLALPALKTAQNIVQYRRLRQAILDLCAADGTLDLFEYALQASVVRELDVYYRLSRGTKVRFSRFEDVVEPFRLVLTYLACEGAPGDAEAARAAFDEGAGVFYVELEPTALETRELGPFSRALNDLSQASPSLKRQMLTAFYRCVAADGVIVEREGELIEAITSAFGVPAPVWRSAAVA